MTMDYSKEITAMQKHFGITTEDFNTVMKLFNTCDDMIAEILRGSSSPQPTEAGQCIHHHYQYMTRVLFPVVDQVDLEDMGFSVAGYFESHFTDLKGEQIHTDPEKFFQDRLKNHRENKRKWLFRCMCKAIAERKVIKGTEQTEQTEYILDPTRLEEIVFLTPTDEQIETQKKAFLESSYYQTISQNGKAN